MRRLALTSWPVVVVSGGTALLALGLAAFLVDLVPAWRQQAVAGKSGCAATDYQAMPSSLVQSIGFEGETVHLRVHRDAWADATREARRDVFVKAWCQFLESGVTRTIRIVDAHKGILHQTITVP